MLGQWGAASLLAAMEVRTAPSEAGRVGVGPALVLLADFGPWLRTEARLDSRYFVDASRFEHGWSITQKIGRRPHFDVWVHAEGLDAEASASSGVGYYW